MESAAFTPNAQSMTKTKPAMSKEATNTSTDEPCNSFQVGQVTFCTNSWYDSCKYCVNCDI